MSKQTSTVNEENSVYALAKAGQLRYADVELGHIYISDKDIDALQ